MIKVLIVDDSEIDRKIISMALSREKDIEIVGTADGPYEARELIIALKPDVITLDIQMPRMNGLDFLSKIMEHHPLPVIIVSSHSQKNSKNALQALEIGALETISKPGLEYNLKQFSTLLARTIKGVSKANVKSPKSGNDLNDASSHRANHRALKISYDPSKIIAIGASTGGTRALEFLLRELPAGLPGIVIVQHLPESFTKSFAERLNKISDLEVKEASDNEKILPGMALIAPGDEHLMVEKKLTTYYTKLTKAQRVHFHRPSVDVLFRSVAGHLGVNATGIILTGMGKDGAEGLLEMKKAGACTFGQDEESSVVYGMPRAAFEIGAVDEQVPLKQIPEKLIHLISKQQTVNV